MQAVCQEQAAEIRGSGVLRPLRRENVAGWPGNICRAPSALVGGRGQCI